MAKMSLAIILLFISGLFLSAEGQCLPPDLGQLEACSKLITSEQEICSAFTETFRCLEGVLSGCDEETKKEVYRITNRDQLLADACRDDVA